MSIIKSKSSFSEICVVQYLLMQGTVLGIDSTFAEFAPLLQGWTHSKSYWITFNEDLESTATICSHREVSSVTRSRNNSFDTLS